MDKNSEKATASIYGYQSYDAPCWMSISHQVAEVGRRIGEAEANIRHDVGDAECDIKEAIHAQSLAHSAEFCGVNKNISDNGYRNVIATKDAACILDKSILESRHILAEKVDRETDVIKERLSSFERQVAEEFCKVRVEAKDNTQKVLDRLTSDKLDEKNEIIDRLRHDCRQKEQTLLFSNQLNEMKILMNSVEQNQRFISKTSQFGIGNVAVPTQTANMG